MEIETTYCLWGKKGSNGEASWLPLIMHLADTVEIGKRLWDEWLCEGAKRNIAANCTYSGSPDEAEKLRQARALFVFLCASHDLGKATPAFQTKDAKVSRFGLDCDSDYVERFDACRRLDALIASGISQSGFTWSEEIEERNKTPHALCSQVIMMHFCGQAKQAKNIAAILGAHHGKPQDNVCKDLDESYPRNFFNERAGRQTWQDAQQLLLFWALRQTECFLKVEDCPCPNQAASVELTGLLVMADWISSNEMLCPYIYFGEPVSPETSAVRARNAWKELNLTERWNPLEDMLFSDSIYEYYEKRFNFREPNSIQRNIIDIARGQRDGGIIIVEAPMGYGKTEAALAAAEILAQKTGRTGLFFALPTQATSNGIFPRMMAWGEQLRSTKHSIHLFHSKAEFNKEWTTLSESMIDDESPERSEHASLIVNQWFSGRKKTMLADFVVGTIDQILMGALRQKHFMLRHLGLSNKVVIIDECHAYDAYMSNYLERMLSWLGIYRVPVIVLSATLPANKRKELIDAYRHARHYEELEEESAPPVWATSRAYPLITSAEIGESDPICHEISISSVQTRISIKYIEDDEIIGKIDKIKANGGCVGIIVNTVARAQALMRQCREAFGDDAVQLFHSRFTAPDRANIETKITRWLGKVSETTMRPAFKIVIGTQVLEQSLDIDFDVMITDLAPMDLMLQRMGRLHRHVRLRPEGVREPVCYVLGASQEKFEAGASVIYGNCLLMRTKALLPDVITLPVDISQLVQDTYNFDFSPCSASSYDEAFKQYKKRIENKRSRAKTYCLRDPQTSKLSTVIGMLKTPADATAGEESVRDLEPTIEAILLQYGEDGYIHLLDDDFTPVAREEVPDDSLAWEISKYRVSLPWNLCGRTEAQREMTVSALECASETVSMWQKARYLKGEVFLILDAQGENHDIEGFVISYTKAEGLVVVKTPSDYIEEEEI